MAIYFPLLAIALTLFAISVVLAWPWLCSSQSRDKALMLCVVGTLLSLALYMAIGSPFALGQIEKEQSFNNALVMRITSLTNELEAVKDPDSAIYAEQWVELGAAYMQIERYADAEDAFRHAVLASEGDPRVIMAYGKAQMLAADGEVTEGAQQAFVLASTLMPDNPEPVFLLAVGKMQSGDKEGARALFKELLPKLPEGAPLRHRILMQLQNAE